MQNESRSGLSWNHFLYCKLVSLRIANLSVFWSHYTRTHYVFKVSYIESLCESMHESLKAMLGHINREAVNTRSNDRTARPACDNVVEKNIQLLPGSSDGVVLCWQCKSKY